METALYLIPVMLGDTPADNVLPLYNKTIILQIKYFIVENVRSARRFLKKIDKSINMDEINFFILNEHIKEKDTADYLEPLSAGNSMGIISEAGCPAIADPGANIVSAAHKKKIKIIPLVGPSSILLALIASGFNGQNFAFSGYLPVKATERIHKIRQLEQKVYKENQTQIFIEAPYRNIKIVESIISSCRSETKLCIAAGLTCPEEIIKVKSISEWKKENLTFINKIPAIFIIYK